MSLNMITDRTSADVTNAKTLRLKMQAGQTLTEAEKTAFERGACTITMLNRIENAKKTLVDSLKDKGYYTGANYKTWTYSDIFGGTDYTTFLNDIRNLRYAFYMQSPLAPDYLYGYKEANDIEQILVDIESYINSMVENYKICGTFVCGE